MQSTIELDCCSPRAKRNCCAICSASGRPTPSEGNWKFALILGNVPDKGDSPWQRAHLLVQLRNHFMHFKPAWDDAEIHDGKFADSLQAAGAEVYGPHKENFIFPYGFMTAGCAIWAVTVALDFAESFHSLIGITSRFADRLHELKIE